MKYYDYNTTAVSHDDYGEVIAGIVQFNVGDINVTHTIPIEQDDECEVNPMEFFTSMIALASGEPPIDVIRETATINIDDTAEPECGKNHLPSIVMYYQFIYTYPEFN